MRYLLAMAGAVLLMAGIAGCTVNTYDDGQREVKTGVPQTGPTSNPADVSRSNETP
ncbi:hypothetical protein ACFO0E_02525 [Chromohalobacter beijerinckii]|jgi:hypothetical protein|uniref:Uncharacterized protein n=2 Tax=Chromohalobacter TaxID=42054 RepID=A0A9X3AXP8_9GAMM|nr:MULTISPECIES: hypothetical protein [Chromohalobacter]NWO09805.1 hypothetical protein [Chromohalobacter salexigens]CDQ34292.1 hypothetical protein BN993_03746 [Virgibacillus halodenitrificans]MCK0766933.1 hypothetical protein [Chromohalobacter beijerinckii]MCK2043275.1 hypothetical protein [Chromohalobacter moromii]MCK2046065.1 hypothetical protein [Chromohalobacter moromii]